jgi:predicted DNA-binding transcriptional regulator AlpA
MQRIPLTPEQLLSDIELAKIYGVKVSTIRKWRIVGKGPRWIKLGALVRYSISDANAFVESCPVGRSA